MKVTLIGHATLLVEMEGLRCLMDPVLQDPFEEGAVVSCPKREVAFDKLPPVDLVIISHRHLDHFDIPTLARLPRKCEVMCPRDHAIAYVLQELGFSRVHQVDSMSIREFPGYEMAITRSENRDCEEFGVLFKDKSGTFWNQVDSMPSPQTLQMTRERYGTVDLHFSMYASQNLSFFDDRGTGFPYKMHGYNLGNVLQLRPRMAVPGSGGFRFSDEFDWCNRFLFPVSREQFVEDLRRLEPSIETCLANPGDEFIIQKGKVQHRKGASPFVRMVEDDTHRTRFDPTAPIPPLVDQNPQGYPAERLTRAVEELGEGLAAWFRTGQASGDAVLAEHQKHRVRYLLRVVCSRTGACGATASSSGRRKRRWKWGRRRARRRTRCTRLPPRRSPPGWLARRASSTCAGTRAGSRRCTRWRAPGIGRRWSPGR
ncbi:MAG: MBL fold metallo-hydrolase [Archangium sp.]